MVVCSRERHPGPGFQGLEEVAPDQLDLLLTHGSRRTDEEGGLLPGRQGGGVALGAKAAAFMPSKAAVSNR